MRKFRVTINGENYLLDMDGVVQRIGFYKTYFLEAVDAGAAKELAMSRIASDPKFQGTLHNQVDDPPRTQLESIDEVPSFDGHTSLEQGYVFYRDDADAAADDDEETLDE